MIGRTNCTQKSGSPSEFVNIQMLTNQAEHSNLNGAVLTMSYETYSKQYTWDGKEITFSVPAHVSCTIEFPSVEGYKKPDNITFVAVEGNSRTIEAEYKAELVKVNVSSSNGSAVSGATLTINGKQQTWNGTEIRQLVPFGTQYSVVAGAVSGFGTPSTQTFTAQNPEREVSVVYIASSLKVNILSNQGTDAAIANVKATVKYGSTSIEVANGGTVNLPTNTSVTISFPEVADYKKPADITYTHTGGLVEKSGTYQCELLTVNVSADSGSVSGFEVTIANREVIGNANKYTRLEYIESNANQYIDTGIIPNQDTKVVIDTLVHSSTVACLFGSRVGVSYSLYYCDSGGTSFQYGNQAAYIDTMPRETRVVVTSDKGVITADGTQYGTLNYNNFTSGASLCLLYDNSTYYASARIYSCQIYHNGSLVRDYIPALRSDGIVGLYDAANDTFTASSGSSNFISGGELGFVIAKQTSVTGTYKIPFGLSYTIQSSSVSGYTAPKSVTRIANSKSYVVEQKYEVIKVRDLSLQDVYGNPINRSTANCYVIREAGQYKFPLVFGNAIKNGQVNTAAFTNNGGANSHDFVFYQFGDQSNKITSPYVTTSTIGNLRILNADVDGCITTPEIIREGDISFAKFEVLNVPSGGANIIVDVPFTTPTKWAWHIWLWPHDLTPVEITNATGVKYNIMPVNLASKYDSDGVHIKNWFYQWGRPTPLLLPSAWNSTTDHTPGSIGKTSKASSLADALGFPTTFYYNSGYPYNWFGDKSYYNLWDAACTETGNSDNDTVKTVYDPCPVGWKVPNGNTFTGLSRISYANGIMKMSRYSGDTVGIEFPMSGCRGFTDGSFNFVGDRGSVWLSSAYSQNLAYNLYFYPSYVGLQYSDGRANGFSVRPVQDDLTKIDTI